MEAAAKILGHLGKKLRTHEIKVRRSENGHYIATNRLGDKHGNAPTDGQRGEKEYSFDSLSNLASHFAEHMPENPQPDDEEETDAGTTQPGA